GAWVFKARCLELSDKGEQGAAVAWRTNLRGRRGGDCGAGSGRRVQRPDDGDEIRLAARAAAAAGVSGIAEGAGEREGQSAGGRGGRGVVKEGGARPRRFAAPTGYF